MPAADRPARVPRRSNMIRAVNRELRTLPERAAESATAELARQLAREVDAGDRAAAGPLMKALDQLRRLAAPPPGARTAAQATAEDAPDDDELDELARARAARLAAAEGVVRPIGRDDRRSRGSATR